MRTSSRIALVFGFAIALAAAGACGGVYSEEAPAPSAEAGADPTDAATAAADTAPPNDAGTGAADADAEASTRFCANLGTQQSTDLFCADFDGTDLSEGFTGMSDAGLAATTVTALSAPNALLAQAPGGSTFFPRRGGSLWWEKLGKPIAVLDVSVGINQPIPAGPPSPGNTGSVELVAMQTESTRTSFVFSQTAPRWTVEIEYVGAGAYGKRDPVAIPLPQGKWTKVNLIYGFRTGNVSVLYDGVQVFNQPGHYYPQSTLLDSKATIRVGAQASGQTFTEPFRFDNLVARVTRE